MPEGYKLLSDVTPAIEAKAIGLLSQDFGYSEQANIDGKDLLFVVETHTWYGANPDAPPTPHKGVTVYEKVISDSSTELPSVSLLPVFTTIGLVGAAYRFLRRKRR
jgi:hypothetical protein